MPETNFHGKVRAHDPESSWDAAEQQHDSKVDAVKAEILTLLSTYGPQTDEELVERYTASAFMDGAPQVTPQSIRTRRKALQIDGLVSDTGRKGRTRLGNAATLWEAI